MTQYRRTLTITFAGVSGTLTYGNGSDDKLTKNTGGGTSSSISYTQLPVTTGTPILFSGCRDSRVISVSGWTEQERFDGTSLASSGGSVACHSDGISPPTISLTGSSHIISDLIVIEGPVGSYSAASQGVAAQTAAGGGAVTASAGSIVFSLVFSAGSDNTSPVLPSGFTLIRAGTDNGALPWSGLAFATGLTGSVNPVWGASFGKKACLTLAVNPA